MHSTIRGPAAADLVRWCIGTGLALAAAGCAKNRQDDIPPRATDTIELAPRYSVISVPVSADLGELRAALEHEVPRTLWTIDKPNQTCAASKKVKVLVVKIKTPTIKCRLVGQVTRGPLAISGSGENLVVTMPIHAIIHARDIGGLIKEESATADARVRAVARLDVQHDWSLSGKVDIKYDWTQEPAVDLLGQHIVLTNQADAKLAGVVNRLERTLPRELAKLNFRQNVERSWRGAFTSLQLNRSNPPVWMRITPQSLNYGGYAINGQKVQLRLGMKARTETYVGAQPADPAPTPLPPVQRLAEKPGELLFYIPVIADYAQLEPVVAEALAKREMRPFEVPGIGPVNAHFGKIIVYGTTGGRIAVGVILAVRDAAGNFGKSSGTVWLTAKPVNAPNSRAVTFTDLKVAGTTDRRTTDLMLKLANSPALSTTIADALAQNFGRDYDELMGKVTRAIAEKRTGDLVIRARIDDVRTGALRAAGRGLYLPVWGTGTAAVELDTH
ncbi:MAG: DUF4403 family protein [Croceibacterium sp.]